MKLTFEESSLSKWLYVTLKDKVDELIVCNPLFLSRKQGPKNDYRDALHLANELRGNHLTPVFHEDNEYMDMRTLMSGYFDIVREGVRAKNRYKCLFRSEALDTKGKTIYKKVERIKELIRPSDRFVAESLSRHIFHLEEEKEKYKALFKTYKTKYRPVEILCSIPGINFIRATVIVSLICSPGRFKNKHKFWAYSMLVKYTNESGGVVYGRRTIQGRRELKNVFIGAAETIIQKSRNTELGKHYDRLRSKDLDHNAAKFDLARKIASICLSLLKHDKTYDDKHEEKTERRIGKQNH